MAEPEDFFVRFWGVRGSVACSGPETVRYGGNTSSLEIRCGPHMLLMDGGTGMRYLGNALLKEAPLDADIFLTHTHFDHVCGLPFFVPFFSSENTFRVRAGHLLPSHRVRHVLAEMMIAPLFPVPLEIFAADITYSDFKAGETLTPKPGVTVRTTLLNHPNSAAGYRIEYGGKSICYLTDTEHVMGEPDQNILALIEEADFVIYDSMYTDDEYGNRMGWGHSTWQEGARLCELANVKTFVVFHHDPDHNDDFMDGVAAEVEKMRPGSIVAKEGMVLTP